MTADVQLLFPALWSIKLREGELPSGTQSTTPCSALFSEYCCVCDQFWRLMDTPQNIIRMGLDLAVTAGEKSAVSEWLELVAMHGEEREAKQHTARSEAARTLNRKLQDYPLVSEPQRNNSMRAILTRLLPRHEVEAFIAKPPAAIEVADAAVSLLALAHSKPWRRELQHHQARQIQTLLCGEDAHNTLAERRCMELHPDMLTVLNLIGGPDRLEKASPEIFEGLQVLGESLVFSQSLLTDYLKCEIRASSRMLNLLLQGSGALRNLAVDLAADPPACGEEQLSDSLCTHEPKSAESLLSALAGRAGTVIEPRRLLKVLAPLVGEEIARRLSQPEQQDLLRNTVQKLDESVNTPAGASRLIAALLARLRVIGASDEGRRTLCTLAAQKGPSDLTEDRAVAVWAQLALKNERDGTSLPQPNPQFKPPPPTADRDAGPSTSLGAGASKQNWQRRSAISSPAGLLTRIWDLVELYKRDHRLAKLQSNVAEEIKKQRCRIPAESFIPALIEVQLALAEYATRKAECRLIGIQPQEDQVASMLRRVVRCAPGEGAQLLIERSDAHAQPIYDSNTRQAISPPGRLFEPLEQCSHDGVLAALELALLSQRTEVSVAALHVLGDILRKPQHRELKLAEKLTSRASLRGVWLLCWALGRQDSEPDLAAFVGALLEIGERSAQVYAMLSSPRDLAAHLWHEAAVVRAQLGLTHRPIDETIIALKRWRDGLSLCAGARAYELGISAHSIQLARRLLTKDFEEQLRTVLGRVRNDGEKWLNSIASLRPAEEALRLRRFSAAELPPPFEAAGAHLALQKVMQESDLNTALLMRPNSSLDELRDLLTGSGSVQLLNLLCPAQFVPPLLNIAALLEISSPAPLKIVREKTIDCLSALVRGTNANTPPLTHELGETEDGRIIYAEPSRFSHQAASENDALVILCREVRDALYMNAEGAPGNIPQHVYRAAIARAAAARTALQRACQDGLVPLGQSCIGVVLPLEVIGVIAHLMHSPTAFKGNSVKWARFLAESAEIDAHLTIEMERLFCGEQNSSPFSVEISRLGLNADVVKTAFISAYLCIAGECSAARSWLIRWAGMADLRDTLSSIKEHSPPPIKALITAIVDENLAITPKPLKNQHYMHTGFPSNPHFDPFKSDLL